MPNALLCLDFINEIVSEGGKLSGKGYLEFAEQFASLEQIATLQIAARSSNVSVIHVGLAFDSLYLLHPSTSPLLGGAKGAGALSRGSWGASFNDQVAPIDGELVIEKNRIGAFSGTALQLALRAGGIEDLVLSGVATDLAVLSTAFSAHDLDYRVTIASDACIAADVTSHNQALDFMGKFCVVRRSDEIAASWE